MVEVPLEESQEPEESVWAAPVRTEQRAAEVLRAAPLVFRELRIPLSRVAEGAAAADSMPVLLSPH